MMDGQVMLLYESLLRRFGHQRWWPADSRYEVVVGALLTQNTNWRNVEKAIANLKEAEALNPHRIISMRRATLEKLIRPSGFYRQKAERLKPLTEKYLMLEKKKWGVEELRKELLGVKGVGKETADSIVLYAFDLPIFVIDAYTRRFCRSNNLFEGKHYDEYRSFFESSVPRSVPLYKEYHALIVEWGKAEGKEISRAGRTRSSCSP